MPTPLAPGFDAAALLPRLQAMSDAELDALDFGVIGFGPDTLVSRYNHWESRAAGLRADAVLQQPLFSVVAQCLNNYLVAQRFEDAQELGEPLDDALDYVLTLRMRPIAVKLRLLSAPDASTRYVLIRRPS